MNPRTKPAAIKAAMDLYTEGVSHDEIERRTGVKPHAAALAAAKAGVSRPRLDLTDDDFREAAGDGGLFLGDIATALGVTRKYAAKRLRSLGLEYLTEQARGPYKARDGRSWPTTAALAETAGLSVDCVGDLLRRGDDPGDIADGKAFVRRAKRTPDILTDRHGRQWTRKEIATEAGISNPTLRALLTEGHDPADIVEVYGPVKDAQARHTGQLRAALAVRTAEARHEG